MDMQTWRDGRGEAVEATEALRAALAALGASERVLTALRPLVTNKGVAYVYVGMVRAELAEQMAEAMKAPASTR
ncbi:hypothetical protein ACPMJQ_27725 [Streptomyces pseudogriseolus]|uniref:hypothetical protein n=1 Tax=Streptomyces pseudogriseolus TaxID=36817 RepID=UPI003FA2E633